MRILAITVGSPNAGSTRFRLLQYRPFLESKGAILDIVEQSDCDNSILERVAAADVVINQKCLLRRSLARKIVKESRRLVFDFDDAIYTRPGRPYGWFTGWRVLSRFHYWLKSANVVTVANQYLAKAAQQAGSRVEVIPMGVDLNQWKPATNLPQGLFRIGWVGAPNNLIHLERLDGIVKAVLQRYPQMRLAVFSGKKPNLSFDFDYTPFAPNAEVPFIQQLHAGLLPLPDEEYSRGKSPIKAIQYLACGVPVIGNVYGATAEICNATNSLSIRSPEDWLSAITQLVVNPQKARELGAAGRRDMEQRHCIQRLSEQLWQTLSCQ